MIVAKETAQTRISYYNKFLRHAIDIILKTTEPVVGSKYSWKEASLHFDVVLIEEFETEHGFYEIDPRHFITVKYINVTVLEVILIEETGYLEVKTLVNRGDIWSGTIRDKAGHIIMNSNRENNKAQEFKEEKREQLKIYQDDLKKYILRILVGAKPYNGHLVSGYSIEDDKKIIKVYRCKSIKEKYEKIYIEFYGRTGLIAILKEGKTEIEKMINPNLWKKKLKELAKDVEERQRKKFAENMLSAL